MGWVNRTTFDLVISKNIEASVLIIFFSALFIQMVFITTWYLHLTRWRSRPLMESQPVSIVICVRNEAERLKKNLPFILDQEYTVFEVLIYDHGSDDHTAELMNELVNDHEQLTYLQAPQELKEKRGKKHVLGKAIAAARYPLVLLTDADCRPAGSKWIKRMVAQFSDQKKIVLGISRYDEVDYWWNGLMQYETTLTAFQYMGFALAGLPYMGVGRNLAYQKAVLDGYDLDSHQDVLSGDDDLTIQAVSTSKNTAICLDLAAHTISEAPSTFGQWVKMKQRHYSAATRYRLAPAFLLLLFKTTVFASYVCLIILLLSGFDIQWIVVLFFFRWIIIASIYHRAGREMGFATSFIFLPWFEIYFVFFDLWLLMKNWISPLKEWK